MRLPKNEDQFKETVTKVTNLTSEFFLIHFEHYKEIPHFLNAFRKATKGSMLNTDAWTFKLLTPALFNKAQTTSHPHFLSYLQDAKTAGKDIKDFVNSYVGKCLEKHGTTLKEIYCNWLIEETVNVKLKAFAKIWNLTTEDQKAEIQTCLRDKAKLRTPEFGIAFDMTNEVASSIFPLKLFNLWQLSVAGFKISALRIKQCTFQKLTAQLKQSRFLIALGNYGIPCHKTPPISAGYQIDSIEVMGWPASASLAINDIHHAVLVVGTEVRKEKEVVLFIDPEKPSVYLRASFEAFIRESKGFDMKISGIDEEPIGPDFLEYTKPAKPSQPSSSAAAAAAGGAQ